MTTTQVKENIKVHEQTHEQEQGQDIFFLKGTNETPEILLDRKKGFMKFSGRSLP
ncbi:MAG: hypothetical protein R6U11_01600 [Bacteroidales bacterium]